MRLKVRSDELNRWHSLRSCPDRVFGNDTAIFGRILAFAEIFANRTVYHLRNIAELLGMGLAIR
jgi:hypothetical protein